MQLEMRINRYKYENSKTYESCWKISSWSHFIMNNRYFPKQISDRKWAQCALNILTFIKIWLWTQFRAIIIHELIEQFIIIDVDEPTTAGHFFENVRGYRETGKLLRVCTARLKSTNIDIIRELRKFSIQMTLTDRRYGNDLQYTKT